MMTREEFIARREAYKREDHRQSIVWAIIYAGVLIGNIPLIDYLKKLNLANIVAVLYGIALFIFLFATPVFLLQIEKRRINKYGLQCPTCGKSLLGNTPSQLAIIGTGHCSHCDAQFFK